MSDVPDEDLIKVAIRIRPKIKREKDQPVRWQVNGNVIYPIGGSANAEAYAFDCILDSDKTNTDLFELIKPIVKSATDGINGTVFAYGQTSSGKTHSIIGTPQDQGIIPQAIDEIFSYIESDQHRKYLIRASYFEIYNEKINDLLNLENTDLKIREDIMGTLSIGNCTEKITPNKEDLLNMISTGNKNRHIGETKMNERSSRSHVIFKMIIESSSLAAEQDAGVQVSYLCIVDLAGSESLKQTDATGQTKKEGCHINKSLFTLTMCLNQCSEGKYVNFRDSKLTRILSNGIGGNSKTLILATITPVSYEQSQSTLTLVKCAKKIKTTPTVNTVLDDATVIKQHRKKEKQLLAKLEEEKSKNLDLQKDQEMKDNRIRDLEQQIQNIEKDFVFRPTPDSSILKTKRRHTMPVRFLLPPVLEITEPVLEDALGRNEATVSTPLCSPVSYNELNVSKDESSCITPIVCEKCEQLDDLTMLELKDYEYNELITTLQLNLEMAEKSLEKAKDEEEKTQIKYAELELIHNAYKLKMSQREEELVMKIADLNPAASTGKDELLTNLKSQLEDSKLSKVVLKNENERLIIENKDLQNYILQMQGRDTCYNSDAIQQKLHRVSSDSALNARDDEGELIVEMTNDIILLKNILIDPSEDSVDDKVLKINEQQNEIKILHESVSELKILNASLSKQLSDLEVNNRNENLKLENEITKLNYDLNQRNDDSQINVLIIAELKQHLAEATEKSVLNQKQSLDKITDLQNELLNQQNMNSNLITKISKARSKYQQLKQHLFETYNEKLDMLDELSDFRDVFDTAKLENREQLSQTEEENQNLVKEVSQLNAKLSEQAELYIKMEKQLLETEEENLRLNNELTQLNVKISDITNLSEEGSRNLTNELSQLNVELREQRELTVKMEKQVLDTEEENIRLKKELTQLNIKIADITNTNEEENQNVTKKLNQLNVELNEQRNLTVKMEKQLSDSEEENIRLKKELTQLNIKISDETNTTEEKSRNLEQELSRLNVDLSEQRDLTVKMEKQLLDTENENIRLKKELLIELENERTKFNETNNRLIVIQKELIAISNERKKYEMEMSEMQKQIAKSEEKHEHMGVTESEIAELKAENDILSAKIIDCTAQIKQLELEKANFAEKVNQLSISNSLNKTDDQLRKNQVSENDLEEMRGIVSALEEEKTRNRCEFERDLKQKHDEIENLLQQNKEAQNEYYKILSELQNTKAQLKEITEYYSISDERHSGDLKQLQKMYACSSQIKQNKIDELTSQLHEFKALKSKHEELVQKYDKEHLNFTASKGNYEELQQKLKIKQNKIEELTSQLHEFKALKSKHNELKQKYEKDHLNFTASKGNYEELQQQLKKHIANTKMLTEQKNELATEIIELKRVIENESKEFCMLKNQLSEASLKIKENKMKYETELKKANSHLHELNQQVLNLNEEKAELENVLKRMKDSYAKELPRNTDADRQMKNADELITKMQRLSDSPRRLSLGPEDRQARLKEHQGAQKKQRGTDFDKHRGIYTEECKSCSGFLHEVDALKVTVQSLLKYKSNVNIEMKTIRQDLDNKDKLVKELKDTLINQKSCQQCSEFVIRMEILQSENEHLKKNLKQSADCQNCKKLIRAKQMQDANMQRFGDLEDKLNKTTHNCSLLTAEKNNLIEQCDDLNKRLSTIVIERDKLQLENNTTKRNWDISNMYNKHIASCFMRVIDLQQIFEWIMPIFKSECQQCLNNLPKIVSIHKAIDDKFNTLSYVQLDALNTALLSCIATGNSEIIKLELYRRHILKEFQVHKSDLKQELKIFEDLSNLLGDFNLLGCIISGCKMCKENNNLMEGVNKIRKRLLKTLQIESTEMSYFELRCKKYDEDVSDIFHGVCNRFPKKCPMDVAEFSMMRRKYDAYKARASEQQSVSKSLAKFLESEGFSVNVKNDKVTIKKKATVVPVANGS